MERLRLAAIEKQSLEREIVVFERRLARLNRVDTKAVNLTSLLEKTRLVEGERDALRDRLDAVLSRIDGDEKEIARLEARIRQRRERIAAAVKNI